MFGARPHLGDAETGSDPVSQPVIAAGTYERIVSAVPASVGAIRRELDQFLTERCVPEYRREDIAVCASELMSNVVVHAYRGLKQGPLAVRAAVADGSLVLTVLDSGRGFRPRTDSPGLGVGLALVAHLAGDLSIARNDPGTRAVARFDDVGSRETSSRPRLASRDELLNGYAQALQRSLNKQEDTRALIGQARQAIARHRQLQRERPER
jgi:serine/threonine-protein kinase RsbW